MAVDLIDRTKRSYEAFNRGDSETALRWVHPEIEWRTYLVPGPGGATYRGHDGVRQLWTDVRNVFDDFRNDAEQFFEADEHIVVFVRFTGRGHESGVAVEARLAHVFSYEDGLLRNVRTFEDREHALRFAGIEAAP